MEQEPQPLSDFAEGVLKDIPENDRPVVAKYLKDWDSNVTKKFQEHAEKIKPYEELGDFENLQQSLYYMSMLQDDPAQFIRTVTQAMKETGMSLDDLFDDGNEDQEEYEPVDAGELPVEWQKRFEEQQQMIQALYDRQESFVSQQSEAQQFAALDKLLENMHSQVGDFDEDYILLQLEKGLTPEKAIEQWNNHLEKFGNQRRPAPTILAGNGMARNDQVDLKKMSKPDRLAALTSALEAVQDR